MKKNHRRCGCPVCNIGIHLLDNWGGYAARARGCEVCNASGICPACGGRQPACDLCDASGTCPLCGGEKVVYD